MNEYLTNDWCRHEWRRVGEPYKTFSRSDVGPDNPLRQANKCKFCGGIMVEVVTYKDHLRQLPL